MEEGQLLVGKGRERAVSLVLAVWVVPSLRSSLRHHVEHRRRGLVHALRRIPTIAEAG